MKKEEIRELSDERLAEELTKMKSYLTYDRFIVGFLIGVSLYSIVSKGFGLLTFLPLLYVPVAGRNKKKADALKEELEKRKNEKS